MTAPSPHVIGRQQICPHENRVPVKLAVGGEVVAQLCLGCDAQLEADWIPRATFSPYGEWPSLPPVYDLAPPSACAEIPASTDHPAFCLAHNQGDPTCTVYPRPTRRPGA